MSSKTYLKNFFEEKGIDLDEYFTVEGPEWGENIMPYQVVVDAIFTTSEKEQDAIADTLRRIDFKNGDVRHYLRHLAQALAM